MTVRRRKSAREDIDKIAEYIGQDSPASAARFLHALEATFSLLSRFPAAGTLVPTRRARSAGLRRINVNRFKVYVAYYVIDDDIEIVRLLHSARDREAIIEDEF